MSDTITSDWVVDPDSIHGARIPAAALALRKLHPEYGYEQAGVEKGKPMIRIVSRGVKGQLERVAITPALGPALVEAKAL